MAIDRFGRNINYLRISLTDRCNLRCVYCMPEDMTFLPKRDLLTLEELDRVCSVFVERGVRKESAPFTIRPFRTGPAGAAPKQARATQTRPCS